jgi:tRNA1(Val) A37 N6-methylase TrmN6
VPELEPSDFTDDTLTGSFRIWQRKRGHRYSLDDVVTAWVAARARPDARCVLDLGCGIGSVLLMLAYKLEQARLWGIEAQSESFELLVRNCERNGVSERLALAHGDLRDRSLCAQIGEQTRARGHDGFELVTGTPPYQPPGRGSVSPDPQRAHARVELRGGVEAYLEAATPLLAPTGLVVVCADARRPERVERSASAHGLQVLAQLHVVASEHKPPLFTVWTLARSGDPELRQLVRAPQIERFVARDPQGARTEAARGLRRFFDLPPAHAEAPSPRERVRSQPHPGCE